MAPDLHIHIAEPAGPVGEQMPGQPFMTLAKPFGIDDDLIGLGLEYLVVDTDKRHGKPFGQF